MNRRKGGEPTEETNVKPAEVDLDVIERGLQREDGESDKAVRDRLIPYAKQLGIKNPRAKSYSTSEKLISAMRQVISIKRTPNGSEESDQNERGSIAPEGEETDRDASSAIQRVLEEIHGETVQAKKGQQKIRTGGTDENPIYSNVGALRNVRIKQPQTPSSVEEPNIKTGSPSVPVPEESRDELLQKDDLPTGNEITLLWNRRWDKRRFTPEQRLQTVEQLILVYRNKLDEYIKAGDKKSEGETRGTLVNLAEEKLKIEAEINSRVAVGIDGVNRDAQLDLDNSRPDADNDQRLREKFYQAALKFGMTREGVEGLALAQLQEIVVPVVAEKMHITLEQALEFIRNPRKFLGGSESDNEVFEPEVESGAEAKNSEVPEKEKIIERLEALLIQWRFKVIEIIQLWDSPNDPSPELLREKQVEAERIRIDFWNSLAHDIKEIGEDKYKQLDEKGTRVIGGHYKDFLRYTNPNARQEIAQDKSSIVPGIDHLKTGIEPQVGARADQPAIEVSGAGSPAVDMAGSAQVKEPKQSPETQRVFKETMGKLETIKHTFFIQWSLVNEMLESEKLDVEGINREFGGLSRTIEDVNKFSSNDLPQDLDQASRDKLDKLVYDLNGIFNDLKGRVDERLAATSGAPDAEAPKMTELEKDELTVQLLDTSNAVADALNVDDPNPDNIRRAYADFTQVRKRIEGLIATGVIDNSREYSWLQSHLELVVSRFSGDEALWRILDEGAEAPKTEEDLITEQEKKMDKILQQTRERVNQAFRDDLINNGHYTPEEADEYLNTRVTRNNILNKAQTVYEQIVAKLNTKGQ